MIRQKERKTLLYQKSALSIKRAAVKCHLHTDVCLIAHFVASFSFLVPFLLPERLLVVVFFNLQSVFLSFNVQFCCLFDSLILGQFIGTKGEQASLNLHSAAVVQLFLKNL